MTRGEKASRETFEIMYMYRNGCSIAQIIEQSGRSADIVYDRLKRSGINKVARQPLTDAQKRGIIGLYKKKWLQGQIATKLGCTRKQVAKYLGKVGLRVAEIDRRTLYKPLSPEVEVAVCKLLDQGHTPREIAEHFNTSSGRICKVRREVLGFRYSDNRTEVKSGSALAKEIVRLRDEEHLCFYRIAKRVVLNFKGVRGTYYRETGKMPPIPQSVLAQNQIDEIVQLYDEEHLSFRQIRDRLGFNDRGAVSRAYYQATGKRLSPSQIGFKLWADPERHQKLRVPFADPEFRRKVSQQMRERWADPDYKLKQSQRIRESKADPDYKLKISQKTREKWVDPDYRLKISQKIREVWARRKSARHQLIFS